MALNPEIVAALALLNDGEGRGLELAGRYPSGEFGTHRVHDAENRFYALKIAGERWIRSAAATTDLLRTNGYPAPEYVSIGAVAGDHWYALLPELPGQSVREFTPELVKELLRLNERQAGLAFLPEPERVADTLLLGSVDGYALHQPLRDYSTATAALLHEIVSIGSRSRNLPFPCTDVVHHDFHPGNILVSQGTVSGVVDWEGTRSGDRAFDMATLLFYTYDQEAVRQRLWRRLLDLAGPERAAVYLAHMMLRQVAYSARSHPAAVVERFLSRSNALLADLRAVR